MNDHSDSIGSIFQALADTTRREVVYRLGAGPASTKELAAPFDMALPSFMQHLSVLEECGLITSEKVGRVRTWEIKREEFAAIETWIGELRAQWEERTDRLADFAEALYRKRQEMSESSLDFIVSRLIRAPRNIVWEAWTMPQHLEKWWVPKPMTAKITDFDLRPGGSFDLEMYDPKGGESSVTGAFLEIVPEERIVFTTALTAEWRPAPTPLPITAIIAMSDDDEGTWYATRVLVKDEEERQKLEAMNFPAGWTLGIDQLKAFAEAMA
jgi:uncharacterized protein YndB with AHSA1/START domain/DNA-binding transcriptional ArsR family regulator